MLAVGHLVALDKDDIGDMDKFVPPQDFVFQYESMDGVMYKNERTKELDEVRGGAATCAHCFCKFE